MIESGWSEAVVSGRIRMKAARVLSVLVLACLATGVASATTIGGRRVQQPARSQASDAKFIDINNISMVVTNTGSFAYDRASGNAGLEFPKGSGKTAVFAAGLWIGAQVGGNTRIAVAEYSDEFKAGAMIGASPDNPNNPDYKVYK